MKTLIIFTFSILFIQNSANASVLDFQELWGKVRENSPGIKRENHEFKASQIAVNRAEKHWLPSLGLSGQGFSTNDPGSNFISSLSQRQITSADFNPSTLNQPGSNIFERFSLGLDLPLYEGGRKISELQALQKSEESSRAKGDLFLLKEYVETAKGYSNLNSLKNAHQRMSELLEKVTALISRYSIGNQSNPVGYSGMLGLRSLKNRAEGVAIDLQSKIDSFQTALSERARLDSTSWETKTESITSFLDEALPSQSEGGSKNSYQEKLALAKSDALEKMRDAERARVLPKIGLFAEEDLTHGSRDTGTSFAGGVYLQWSLFNPDHLGRVDAANELHLAAVSDAASVKQSSVIERKTLVQNEEAMKKSLTLLLESEMLLSEQMKVASRLFQSGSITALQFTEVLNRRVDLILSLRDLEQNLIEIRAKRVSLSESEGLKL